LAVVGRVFLAFLANLGRVSIFTGKSLSAGVTPPFYWRLCLQQMMTIGYYSLPVVGMGEDMAEADPAGLSGGMRKRVGLARAIATEPDIIFFDEPTTGLDPIMGDVINNLITECVQDLGATTLTISHDMSSARTIADRVAMLYDGRIIWAGGVDQIDHCENEFVDQFIHGREEGPFALEVS
jgi:phospholipid/cholesterol/gamma-HCH transport system ATP-binding protein